MTAPASERERWVDVISLDAIEPGAMRAVKLERRQLVVGRRDDGETFALDNACPHEGYPLAQGDLKGCMLTCQWHNWKFDVRDGDCVLGGEGVRRYPTRIENDWIQAELSDPDPEQLWPRLRSSLADGLFRHEVDRCLRDTVRLLQADYPARELLLDIALDDAERAEYGTTHVLPACADAARLLDTHPGLDAIYPIAPALELCSEANRRLAPREAPAAIPGADSDSLLAALEEEELVRAEGLLRGALADPTGRLRVTAWMYRLLAEHFTDFGHQLIYMVKLQELARGLDPERVAGLYPGLLYSLGTATREDTLPYWRPYRRQLEAVEDRLTLVWQQADPSTSFEFEALRDAVLDGSPEEAFQAVWQELDRGVPGSQIARALVAAGAWRLARFDGDVDGRDDVAETWLWATHRFTFASAVRNALERFPSPHALKFLFQAVGFINSGRPMDGDATVLTARPGTADAEAVLDAVRSHDPDAAVSHARACLSAPDESGRLARALEHHCLSAPFVRPIIHVHALKTTIAALEEREVLGGHPDGDVGLLATIRFLASPVVEKRTRSMASIAVQWVADGKRPRKLTQ